MKFKIGKKSYIFFTRTPKEKVKSESEKFIESIMPLAKEYIESIKLKKQKNDEQTPSLVGNGRENQIQHTLYDFFLHNFPTQFSDEESTFEDGMLLNTQPGNIMAIGSGGNTSGNTNDPPKPQKIKCNPKDVLDELEHIPIPEMQKDLEEKIEALKDKSRFISQRYAKMDVKGMLERLENRKKYFDHEKFFSQFPNTSDEKIDALLQKYDLIIEKSDIFVPEFPKIAISLMKNYENETRKLCDKNCIFYVIAPKEMFKKAYKKRDPILLVQSPFGYYWQILGAWDKEMVLLSEL